MSSFSFQDDNLTFQPLLIKREDPDLLFELDALTL